MKTLIQLSVVAAAFGALATLPCELRAQVAPQKALEDVRPRLFRVVSSAPGKPQKGGTAYLLSVTVEEGERFAHFATCYHVVNEQEKVDIYPTSDFMLDIPSVPAVAKFADGQAGWIHSVPTLDLVLLRAPAGDLPELPLPPLAPEQWVSQGYVFGFPSFDSREPYPLAVAISPKTQEAIEQSFYRPGSAPGPRMKIRFLTGDITFPGMSGGPALDGVTGSYGGMLLGRMPDPAPAPVILTGDLVAASLRDANWQAFDPQRLKASLPYAPAPDGGRTDFGQYMDRRYMSSVVNWTSLEQWEQAISDDPTAFLREFQEASVQIEDLRRMTDAAAQNQSSSLTFQSISEPVPNESVDFLWNGWEWSPGDPAPMLPGENLLIIRKHLNGSGFVVNDLVRPNRMHVGFNLGPERVFEVERSLPAVVRDYSIFVTVHNGDIADMAAEEAYNARLAVRLDYLNSLVNQVPFNLPIRGSEPRLGAVYETEGRTQPGYFQIRYVSPQSFDAELSATLKIRKLDLRFAGVRIGFPAEGAPEFDYPLTVAGRVQFPAEESDAPADQAPTLFFVSPRAHAAKSVKPLSLPLLGDQVEVDVGPIARQALVSYVNKELLIPDQVAVPGPEQLRGFLSDVGAVAQLQGRALLPVRAFLHPEPGAAAEDLDRIWLVLTFRMLEAGGNAPDVAGSKPPLLPDEEERRSIGMEFLAHGLPVAAARPHLAREAASSNNGNVLGRELTVDTQAREIVTETLRLALGSDRLPAFTEPLALDAKAERLGQAVGDVLRAAVDESPKRLHAVLRPDAPVKLLAALAPGVKLLAADHQATGRIQLDAETSPEGGRVALSLADANGYSATWKGETVLAEGVSVTDLQIRLHKGELEGQLKDASFQGSATGEIVATKLRVGQDEFQEVVVALKTIRVDSSRPKTEQLEICFDVSADFWRRANGTTVKDPTLQGMRLRVGVETTAGAFKEQVLEAAAQSLLFQADGC